MLQGPRTVCFDHSEIGRHDFVVHQRIEVIHPAGRKACRALNPASNHHRVPVWAKRSIEVDKIVAPNLDPAIVGVGD